MSEPATELKLPDTAYRELAPGEEYVPVIPAEAGVLEVTVRSIGLGLFMGILFSAAAAYISLKPGQGIEAAIPISILAVGAAGNWLGLVMFCLFALFVWWDASRAADDEGAGPEITM